MSNLKSAFATHFLIITAILAPSHALAQGGASNWRSFAARQGILSLRNGQILRGKISILGDRFVIRLDQGGEVRVPVKDVELEAKDLGEVYAFKLNRFVRPRPEDHLHLANWCLNHHLILRAMDQIEMARRHGPSPHLLTVERRLKSAINTPAKPAVRTVAHTAVQTNDLQQLIRQLPQGTMQRFTHTIQPLLVNRCAGCHGHHTGRRFKLHRPARGRSLARRLTQQNLHATLGMLDRQTPNNSDLLIKPSGPHGFSGQPVFSEKNKKQLRQLTEWVMNVTRQPTAVAAAPKAIPQPNSFLLQANKLPTMNPSSQTFPARGASQNSGQQADNRPTVDARQQPPEAGDPFDPTSFNQRFHGERSPRRNDPPRPNH